MDPLAAVTTRVLALGTIAMQAGAALLLALVVLRRSGGLRFARPYLLPGAFVLTLAGSALTLVYSELFGFIPCFWCWVQRAFLYPIPLLIALAAWKKWPGVWKAVIGLAIPGAVVALYQHYLQVGGASLVPCPAMPGAADCGKRLIFEFGYITFPLMAFSIFLLVIALMLLYARLEKERA